MARRLGKKRLAELTGLAPADRYRAFVAEVADTESLWGLRGHGAWAAARTDDGRLALPVWPRPELAELCAAGDWARTAPAELTLAELLEAWLPELARDGRAVSVFPTPASPGIVVAPDRLGRDLRDAADLY